MTKSNLNKISRRRLLQTAAGAVVLSPYCITSKNAFAASADDSSKNRPRIGCIGVGSMGSGDAKQHAHFGEIVAVCDVDSRHAERAKHDPGIGKGKADTYKDYRHVLDRKDIDVVSIVTPDHWHIKPAIEALMAGKHIFIQKTINAHVGRKSIDSRGLQKIQRPGRDCGNPTTQLSRSFSPRGEHGAKGTVG